MASSSSNASGADRPLRPPYWCWLIRLFDSKNQLRRLLRILSSVLLRTHIREIGRYKSGELGSFSGLGIGVIIAVFHSSG